MTRFVFHFYRHGPRPKQRGKDEITPEGAKKALERGLLLREEIPESAEVIGMHSETGRARQTLEKLFEGAGITPSKIIETSQANIPVEPDHDYTERIYPKIGGTKYYKLVFGGRKPAKKGLPAFKQHYEPLIRLMQGITAEKTDAKEKHAVVVTHQGKLDALFLALAGRKFSYVKTATDPLEKVVVELRKDGTGTVRFRGLQHRFNLEGKRIRRMTKTRK